MMSRVVTWSAAIVLLASSAALADPSKPPEPKTPVPKAARVPTTRPKVSPMRPAVKKDEPPMTDTSTSAPAAPAQQVTQLATAVKGTYACTSSVVEPSGRVRSATAKMKVATDLDGYWISYDVTEAPAADNPYPAKLHIARTYAPDARLWTSIARDNAGRVEVTTTSDAAASDATWLGNTHRDGARAIVRTRDERDAKSGTLRLLTEVSTDGKTYVKQYELSCNKK